MNNTALRAGLLSASGACLAKTETAGRPDPAVASSVEANAADGNLDK